MAFDLINKSLLGSDPKSLQFQKSLFTSRMALVAFKKSTYEIYVGDNRQTINDEKATYRRTLDSIKSNILDRNQEFDANDRFRILQDEFPTYWTALKTRDMWSSLVDRSKRILDSVDGLEEKLSIEQNKEFMRMLLKGKDTSGNFLVPDDPSQTPYQFGKQMYVDILKEKCSSFIQSSMRATRSSANNKITEEIKKYCKEIANTLDLFDKTIPGTIELKDYLIEFITSFKVSPFAVIGQSLTFVIQGNPGVGKTYLVNYMVKVFDAMGILLRGKLLEKTRVDFVGQHVGETAPRTKAMLLDSLEQVIFVDEAYSLTTYETVNGVTKLDSYSEEAVNTLVNWLELLSGLLIFIAAGYEENMQEEFLAANAGMRRRFSMTVTLDDKSPKELTKMLRGVIRTSVGDVSVIQESFFSAIQKFIQQTYDMVSTKKMFLEHGYTDARAVDAASQVNRIFESQSGAMKNLGAIAGNKINYAVVLGKNCNSKKCITSCTAEKVLRLFIARNTPSEVSAVFKDSRSDDDDFLDWFFRKQDSFSPCRHDPNAETRLPDANTIKPPSPPSKEPPAKEPPAKEPPAKEPPAKEPPAKEPITPKSRVPKTTIVLNSTRTLRSQSAPRRSKRQTRKNQNDLYN